MSANAVFSNIFAANTIGDLTPDLKSLFVSQISYHSIGVDCNQQITRNTEVLVLYITQTSDDSFEASVTQAILPNITRMFCYFCQKNSGSTPLLHHYVSLPTFLIIELSPHCITHFDFPKYIEVLQIPYHLKGLVKCLGAHFTALVFNEGQRIYIDDLSASVTLFSSLQSVFYSYPGGWFYGIFEKHINHEEQNIFETPLSNPPEDNFDLVINKKNMEISSNKMKAENYHSAIEKEIKLGLLII